MSKVIIYGAGLLVASFIVGMLVFLTFDNMVSGQAIYGTRSGSYFVSGAPSILVNAGILGMVLSFILYIGYLFNRKALIEKASTIIGVISGVLVLAGIIIG